ncbi:MAG: SprB repeat-containing protein, partial [Flavobacteriales bacterium]
QDFQTTATADSLCAGTYKVVVTDDNNCQDSAYETVSEPSAISLSTDFDSSTCGNSNGKAIVSASGGSGGFSYQWDDASNQTDDTATGLAAATYKVVVTDDSSCQDSANVTVKDASSPSTNMVDSTMVSCNGGSDGDAEVSASGGNPPYTYNWSGGTSNDSVTTNLSAGTYTVDVTDDNGCVSSEDVVITEPNALNTSMSKNNVTCNGDCDGDATVSVSGGTIPYDYSWNNSSDTTATADSLCAGKQKVTVTDTNNCTIEDSVTITEPNALTLSESSSTDASCNNVCDGQVLLSTSGGTGTYKFSKDTGTSFQSDSTFSNLCADSYDLIVKDDNNCQDTITSTVSEPNPLTFSTTVDSVTCNGDCDGQIDFTSVNGGNSSYEYSIDNGGSFQSSSTFSSLCAGSYNLIVKDNKGCEDSGSVSVEEPNALSFTKSSDSASCNGVCDGQIDFPSTSGGTSPYQYSIDNGSNFHQDSTTFPDQCAGSYDLEVKDDNGCSTTSSINVNEPSELVFNTSVDSASGNGICDGKIEFTSVSGGTTPYDYSIDNGGNFYRDSTVYPDQCAGTYDLIVKDDNGCDDSATVTLGEPDELSFSTIVDSASCKGNSDGKIEFDNISGGVKPYQFSIDNGSSFQSDSVFNNLSAGTYNLILKDDNGNDDSATVTVEEPDTLDFTVSIDSASCNGVCDGEIDFTSTSGGTTPYEYSIDNGSSYQSNSTFSGECAGNYDLKVKDANNCEVDSTVSIKEPNALSFNTSTDSTSCNGVCDGKIEFTSTNGGTSPYDYSIDNGGNYHTDSTVFPDRCAGSYDLIVKDANGCDDSSTVNVEEPNALSFNTGTDSASCKGVCDGKIEFTSTSGGTSPYDYSIDNGGNYHTDSTVFPDQCAGSYDLIVRDANGCDDSSTVSVEEPDTLDFTLNIDS